MKTEGILRALRTAGRTTDFLLNVLAADTFRPRRGSYFMKGSHLKEDGHNFYALLSQLRKQGFIEKSKKSNKTYWIITDLGKKRLSIVDKSFPKHTYSKEHDDGTNVIIFDIPEKERLKRNWMRQNLVALGFTLLQKSVWIGKNKVPKDFLEDLSDLNLLSCTHIFRVYKFGTINK